MYSFRILQKSEIMKKKEKSLILQPFLLPAKFNSGQSFPWRQSLLVPTSDQIADWKNTRALQKKGQRNCKTTNKQKEK